MQNSTAVSHRLLGWAAVFGSAFFFYFSTVVIRLAQMEVDIDVSYFAFSRFVLGFVLVAIVMIVGRHPVRVNNYHYLLGRMVANTVAVYCFFQSASLGTVAEANILNMTYPLFVALASWFIFKQQRDKMMICYVILAFCGVWLVLAPVSGMAFSISSVWGLASGFTAAAAIIYLNLCRLEHDSNTILFVLFGLGSLLIYLFFHDSIFIPNKKELYYLSLCSVTGVAGQYLLTYGFRFVTAVEGSVISSTRILLAAILGPVLVSELPLGGMSWAGALLIFTANVGLAMRRKRPATPLL